jgi:hypothetical protein
MSAKAELPPKPPGNSLVGGWAVIDVRLKKLRRERHLVERAILALTEISRTRQLRDRRASRN